MASQSILIVEDDPLVQADILGTLAQGGLQAIGPCSSGEEALIEAERARPALCLMDVQLNGPLDGIDTAKQLRDRFAIPVIFLTGCLDSKTVERARTVLPYGYLSKPFTADGLVAAIEVGLFHHAICAERDLALHELQMANQHVERLQGLIPICAHCKRIRDDSGFWNAVEQYIEERSEARFSHGICPTCVETHFGYLKA